MGEVLLLVGGILLGAVFFFIFFWKDIAPNPKKAFINRYSSKIKNIYLELHNYSFFHSPEGMKKAYSRYIGREALRKKLRTILSTSETRSGAYLVTGFRGMGKTSLVRKAIVEMKGNHYYALNRHVRLFLFMVILHLFTDKIQLLQESLSIIKGVLVGLSILSAAYLAYHDTNFPNLWRYYKTRFQYPSLAWVGELFKSLVRMLDPEIDFFKRSKFKVLLQDVILITIMYNIFLSFSEGDFFLSELWLLLKVNFVYFLLVFFYNNYTLENSADYTRKRITNFFLAFVRIFGNSIKRLDFGNKVVIEVSLSQDELKETDILKLLAKNIYNEYRSLRSRIFAPNRLIFPLIVYGSLYMIVALLYYYKPIYNRINEVRLQSGIAEYFPSQGAFPLIRDTISGDSLGRKWKKFPEQSRLDSYIDSVNVRMEEYYNDSIYKDRKDVLRLDSSHFKSVPVKATINMDAETIHIVGDGNGIQSESNLKQIGSNYPKMPHKISRIGNSTWRDFLVLGDLILQSYYRKILHPLVYQGKRNPRFNFHEDFRVFPIALDYFFILTVLLFFLFVTFLERNSWRFGIINHRHILSRLKFLNESIASQITQDQGRGIGITPAGPSFRQPFTFFQRKTRAFPLAGVREIENELIDILSEIDRIPNLSSKPEFIFVFDELDKIEAQYNATIQEKENEELSTFSQEDEGYFSTESIRKRQETIARILGNLKLFFNTARAKFIFIAGREMFDASLADVSDRESFISSIFHEIIYVESFFKDTAAYEGNSNITSTTEEFVCQLLLPRFSKYSKNLNGYNEYLKDNFSKQQDSLRMLRYSYKKFFNQEAYRSPHDEKEEQRIERRKAIYIVEQFITYLTYRGNGAPKKITKLLESFVVNPTRKELKDRNVISFSRNTGNLYLHFDYLCQYRLGLTHHLFKPYLISNSNHMRDFGDKMLLATSFLMDHLFKYHSVGFSWQNLELTPEIIAVNKSPELRRFISRLINFMSGSHIHEIINGLYQFKFNIKLTYEIKYISTISEVESAAFNFTLDESLVLKRHYRKKLKAIIKTYGPFLSESYKKDNFNQSVAMINMMLGDMHFNDREFDEALLHYRNALQDLDGKKKEADYSVDELIFLVGHHLKLGATYERIHDYESAFIAYGSLIRVLRKFSADIEKTINNKLDKKKKLQQKERIRVKRKLFENLRVVYQPLVAQFALIEKGSPNGITADDVLRVQDEFHFISDHLEQDEKFLVECEFYSKLGDILFYKNGTVISKSKDKFKDQKKIYFHSLDKVKKFRDQLHDFDDLFNEYPLNQTGKEKEYRDYLAPVSGFNLYKTSLYTFVEKLKSLNLDLSSNLNQNSPSDKLPPLANLLNGAREFISSEFRLGYYDDTRNIEIKGKWIRRSNKQYNIINAIAGNLSDLGDSLVAFLTRDAKVPLAYLEELMKPTEGLYSSGERIWSDEIMVEKLGKARGIHGVKLQMEERIVYLYLLSNQYYLKQGNYYQCLLQLKKLLLFIRRITEFQLYNKEDPYSDRLTEVSKTIAFEAFEMMDSSNHHTRRQKIYEWEGIFSLDSSEKDKNKKLDIFRRSFLSQPEGMDTLIQFRQIQLGSIRKDNDELVRLIQETRLANAYAQINSKYNRVFELSYKCEIHFHIINNIIESYELEKYPLREIVFSKRPGLLADLTKGIENIHNYHKIVDTPEDFLIYLISDSLYCLSEIIRSFNVFGITYVCNYSLNAISHEHLAFWCLLYQAFKNGINDKYGHGKKEYKSFFKKLDEHTKNILGRIDVQFLDTGYHYKMAIKNYYDSIQMHNGGENYRDALKDLYYLDDDFDDSLSHFCVALERLRINNGFVRKKIKSLKEKLKENELFDTQKRLLDQHTASIDLV